MPIDLKAKAGLTNIHESMYEAFWRAMGGRLVPYKIDYNPLNKIFTILGVSPFYQELAVEYLVVPYYSFALKEISAGEYVIIEVTMTSLPVQKK